MTLSTDQQQAADKIIQKLQDGESVTLTGPAGTGKTYLCAHLVEKLNPALCALTHKAATVLNKATKKEVYTLASILKQKKRNNFNTGETKFVPSGSADLPDGKKILFIDEASMMSEKDLKHVREGMAHKHPILYIGDEFQLPPVQEEYSTALLQDDVEKVSLTTPVRFAADSGIHASSSAVRDALENNLPAVSGMRKILAQHSDVFWISQEEAVPMMIEAFKRSESVDAVRMISFTNKRVDAFNYHLKRAVTGDTALFQSGDLLIANETFSRREKQADGGYIDKLILRNNETIKVRSISVVTISGIEAYQIEIDRGVVVPVPVDREAFLAGVFKLKQRALSFPSGSTERKQAFREMFTFQEGFANLRLSYAQTVHKSQGSTYQTTFFDLAGIQRNTGFGRRLLYTGITRAAKKLVFFK